MSNPILTTNNSKLDTMVKKPSGVFHLLQELGHQL